MMAFMLKFDVIFSVGETHMLWLIVVGKVLDLEMCHVIVLSSGI